jgi:hypothetical protein
MREVRPPVALLRSVVRERFGAEIVPQRRRPAGEFQGVEASPDVGQDLADDGALVMNPTTRILWPHRRAEGDATPSNELYSSEAEPPDT